MSLKDVIPTEFYRGDEGSPYVETVEQMIEQLKRLPADLPVRHGVDYGCCLTVYNINLGDAHLEVVDADD